MCDDDFGDPVELQSRWRIARKPHDCFACGEVIRIDDRYHFVVQNYDGKLSAFKHCARCWMMCEAILEAGAVSVQWDLNCGATWEDAFGRVPDQVAVLAFITADEAQSPNLGRILDSVTKQGAK